MLRNLRGQPAIGVEVSAVAFRLVQADPGGVLEAVSIERREGEAGEDGWPGVVECQRIAGLIARRRFRGKTLVLSVPQHACRFAEVEGVGGTDEAARCVNAGQLAGVADNFKPGDYTLAATPVPGGSSRMLVRGCRREPLLRCCEAFATAGLEVSSVRTRPDAIAAAADRPVATAFLDLAVGGFANAEGGDATRAVLVVVEAGKPVYARAVRTPLPRSLGQVSPAVSEAVVIELLAGIRHAEGRCVGDRVDFLTATVPMAGDPVGAVETFVAGLRERMELQRGDAGETRPFGLAESLSRAAEATVEILPHSHRAHRRQLAISRSMLAAAAAYAAALALLMAILSSARPAPADAAAPDRLQASIEAATAQTLATDQEVALLEAQADGLAAEAVAAAATADRPDWRRLLDRLAADAGDRVQLTEVEVSPRLGDAVAIRVAGQVSDPRSAWDFALALERGELFDRVDLARTRRVSTAEGSDIVFQADLRLLPLSPPPAAEDGP